MAMIGKVLRMRHRENKSVREIVKATSLSRNTVRKYLRIDKAEAPKYRRPGVPTKLAPFVEALQQALLADARRPKKERRTARTLHARLQLPTAEITRSRPPALGQRSVGRVGSKFDRRGHGVSRTLTAKRPHLPVSAAAT
jgi:hypothetical protein